MPPELPERYFSLSREGVSEFTEKKSRFIGYATHALEAADAMAYVEEIHRRHPECSAVLYGYICGYSGAQQKCFDAHEPQGGIQILDALKKQGLTGAVAAVVRYYGGVQLGAGPLGRAFGRAAALAVAEAHPAWFERTLKAHLELDYTLSGKAEHFFKTTPYRLERLEYGAAITLYVTLKQADETLFRADMAGLTAGAAQITIDETTYASWE